MHKPSANTVVEIDNVRLRPKQQVSQAMVKLYSLQLVIQKLHTQNIKILVLQLYNKARTPTNAVRNIDYTEETGDAFITMLSAC